MTINLLSWRVCRNGKDKQVFIFSYCIGQDANVVGAGLAPVLIQGDRKGRPYTFRVRMDISYHFFDTY